MAAPPSWAYTTTCQDVIDADDEAVMDQAMRSLREIVFKGSALRNIEVFHREMQSKGVKNALQATLDVYEEESIPVRDGAGVAFDVIVASNGSLKGTITGLCSNRTMTMTQFFSNFYDFLLKRRLEHGSP